MERGPLEKLSLSRRQFLLGVPVGIAGVFVLGSVLSRLLPSFSRQHSGPPDFPKGSIFTPAKNRRPQG